MTGETKRDETVVLFRPTGPIDLAQLFTLLASLDLAQCARHSQGRGHPPG